MCFILMELLGWGNKFTGKGLGNIGNHFSASSSKVMSTLKCLNFGLRIKMSTSICWRRSWASLILRSFRLDKPLQTSSGKQGLCVTNDRISVNNGPQEWNNSFRKNKPVEFSCQVTFSGRDFDCKFHFYSLKIIRDFFDLYHTQDYFVRI